MVMETKCSAAMVILGQLETHRLFHLWNTGSSISVSAWCRWSLVRNSFNQHCGHSCSWICHQRWNINLLWSQVALSQNLYTYVFEDRLRVFDINNWENAWLNRGRAMTEKMRKGWNYICLSRSLRGKINHEQTDEEMEMVTYSFVYLKRHHLSSPPRNPGKKKTFAGTNMHFRGLRPSIRRNQRN